MSAVDGVWRVQVAAPLGAQWYTLDLREAGGFVSGTATDGGRSYPIERGRANGGVVTFVIDVPALPPFGTVAFTLSITGDEVRGQAQAGPWPQAAVMGSRER